MISTPITQGLAFGRLGGVGFDANLTGLFLFFHCDHRACLGREEDFNIPGTRNIAQRFFFPSRLARLV